jgi:hypothetical protein
MRPRVYQAISFGIPLVINALIVRALLQPGLTSVREQFALLISILPLMSVIDLGESNLLILNASKLTHRSAKYGRFLASYLLLKAYKFSLFLVVASVLWLISRAYMNLEIMSPINMACIMISCWSAYSQFQDCALLRGLDDYKSSSYCQVLASFGPLIACSIVLISGTASRYGFFLIAAIYYCFLAILPLLAILKLVIHVELITEQSKPKLNISSILTELYQDGLNLGYITSTASLSLSSYLYVQFPKIYLLTFSSSVASTFAIFQSLAFKVNGFASAINEVHLNKSSRQQSLSTKNLLEGAISLSRTCMVYVMKKRIILFFLVALVSMIASLVLIPKPFQAINVISLFILISGSVLSASRSRFYYQFILARLHSKNTLIQWAVTAMLCIMLLLASFLQISTIVDPLFVCSAIVFISQITYACLYDYHASIV